MMKRYDIYGDGSIIEVSDREFLQLLAQFVEGCYSFAKSYIVNHASGLADFGNEYFKPYAARIKHQYNVAMQGIDDKELAELLSSLVELINTLSTTDDQIIAAYHEAISQTRKSRSPEQNLKRDVYNYLYRRQMPAPAFVIKIAQETASIIPTLDNIVTKLREKMKQLMPTKNQ